MSKSKQGQPAYSGELARPICPISADELFAYVTTLGKLSRINDIEAELLTNRLRDKIPLLFKHFKIDEGNYPALAVALATRHVRGFSVAKDRPGAKSRWTPYEVALLRFDIEATQSEKPGRSFADAARSVAKDGHWNIRLRSPAKHGETLRRRALSADPRLLKLVRSLYSQTVSERSNTPPSPRVFVLKYLHSGKRLGNIVATPISA